MERNLRLYTVYQVLRGSMFWLPVFVLYFLSVLSMEEALLLEAIYYFAVVLLELPSGYLSDRAGRRLTLVISVVCGIASAVLFALTAAFAPFAIAQVLRAAGMAFNSGTDSSLLYDSLEEVGRSAEIGEREGRAHSYGLAAGAIAALVGGLVAGLDLRWVWWLTAGAELGALVVVLRFAEPVSDRHRAEPSLAASGLVSALRRPVLLWTFAFVVGMTVLNHVPYTFFQPYLELLLADRAVDGYALTPALSGLLAGGMMAVGAWASASAMRVRALLGVFRSLLAATALQLAIIVAMGAVLSPWIVGLILLRSAPMGLLNPIVRAEIHPRVETQIRATYLSLQSLAGRLAFSACLATSSWAVGERALTHSVMSGVLFGFAGLGVLLLLGLTPFGLIFREAPPARRARGRP